jgi:hypothetical protein
MIDYHGQGAQCGLYQCPPPQHPNFHEIDSSNNTYTCVRTLSVSDNSIYCEFADNEVGLGGKAKETKRKFAARDEKRGGPASPLMKPHPPL